MRRKCACAQIMRLRRVLCADAYSAQTMRIVRMVRICACAVLRCVRICAACAPAQVRCRAVYAEAETPRGKAQSASFSFVFSSGRAIPATKHGFPDTRAGKCCAMKVAKHTPATRCRRPQHELSRTRAAKGPPPRNAVTLDVLEHVHTSKFPIPAVCVDVKKQSKNHP